jgi:hypothetical protein
VSPGLQLTCLTGELKLGEAHVSLNSSGTLDVPVSQGGRATDALLDLKEFLDHHPAEGETRADPWGARFCPAGKPRWQAWGRLESPDVPFLSQSTTDIIDRGALLHGCNAYTGSMVFTVAYESYVKVRESGSPINVRQATVSEPGAKARIITTGPWWLAVLQQPFAHMAGGLLAFHPCAHSCLLRCDQAWQALKVLEKSPLETLPPGFRC